ncbi:MULTISPECIES: TM0106 family RecB-like putative nuclease [unclassified Luteococcus]|uniref:TM0106 family RecB-like putative nuclease n=1 Tax=unclassified Luteococcus TaxID=2639923 RepID=UPI00313E62E7
MAIILDPYAARSCPVKTQNRFDPLMETPQSPPDEALQELFAGGKAYEDEVLHTFSRSAGALDLREIDDRQESQRLTLEALAEGRPVVIGPRLPIDVVGHRKGQPDALVRGADQADGRPGYRPVEVKRHRVLEITHAEWPCRFSRLSSPAEDFERVGFTFRASREGDLLQMVHYWRLVEAAGFAAGGAPTAGVVGTDQPFSPHQPVISWVDLSRKFLRTFSRTAASGWRLRSALERYDHEFGFRVKVAEVASRRTGQDDDPRPMVSPIVVRECDHCTWWEACKPQLRDDDLSLRISKSPLDVREISVLRSRGINTLADLAGTDVEALMESYLPEVAHRPGAESRLRLAARRASLMLAGVELERLNSDPIELPEVSLEIDFDIETSAGDRVYLWGFLVDDRTSGNPPFYKAISRFEELDNATEEELAAEAIGWLDRVTTERPDALVYHYSDYEVVHLMRLAKRLGDPAVLAAANRVRTHLVDMFTLMKGQFFGTNGLGLKVVARSGPGFEWRDDDPGGLNSQKWFRDAVTGPDELTRTEATTRVLEYNEDDVRATHQLRGWLRGLDD